VKKNYLRFCFLLSTVSLVSGCTSTNFFNIQLWNKTTYDKVNVLMNEIYQHAVNGNIDFFHPFVERRLRESAEHMGVPHREEAFIIEYTKDIMSQFVEARIHRTYKTKAFLTRNGVLFDFSQERRRGGTNFIIVLTFDQNDSPLLYEFFMIR